MALKKITLVRMEPEEQNVFSAFSHPGLALPILGTILKELGYEVKIYVGAVQRPSVEDLIDSDLVGFSVNSSAFLETYKLASQLKKKSGCKILFGGPHVSFLPNEALKYGDFVIRSEGETAIRELVEAIDQGEGKFDGILGLSWKDEAGEVVHNENRLFETNLDTIPDFNLIVGFHKKMHSLSQLIYAQGMLVSTTRGCSYSCNFCTIPQTFGQKIRYRDPDIVIEDIRRQVEFSGGKYIYFTDDNFAINSKFTMRLLRKIIDSGLKIKFSAQVRSEITRNKELMQLMADAGCYLVFVGYESINDDTLAAYNKGGKQAKEMMVDSVRIFHDYNILVHGMFVLGGDTDTPGVAIDTAKWAIENQVDSLQMLPLTPLPGTDTIMKFKQEKRVITISNHQLLNNEFIPYGAGNYVLIQPKQMSPATLQQDLMDGYSLFYGRSQIWKQIKRVGRFGLAPMLFKYIGRKIFKSSIPGMRKHKEWLKTIRFPEVSLAESPLLQET